jgi:two-component system phosphate regulon sensor histidine kinase PhoR
MTETGRSVLRALILVLLPIVLVGGILASEGLLDPLGGLVALGAVALILALLAYRYLRAVDDLRRLAESLAADGTQPYGSHRSHPVLRGLGAAIARLDRTHRERERALERLVEAGNIVFDSVPDPLILLDADGRILSANRAARESFQEPLPDRHISAVLRQPTLLQAVLAAQHGNGPRMVELVQSDPVERILQVTAQPVPAEPGAGKILLACRDVTAERRSERMRGDFVANASHELRTPLASLLGFIETLRGAARDDVEARDRFLGIMLGEAQRMSRLVSDLLSLSRIELKEHQTPTGSIDVAGLIESVTQAVELAAARRSMRIVLDGAKQLPPVVGDADELKQLLHNLVENALKYGRQGGTVTISATLPDSLPPAFPRSTTGAVAIAVRDEGEGIAREHLPRLTERFYRVDAGRSKAVGGTGLGLAIVKHIVSRHRGALVIDSEIGQGSVFTVYLPVARNRAEPGEIDSLPRTG